MARGAAPRRNDKPSPRQPWTVPRSLRSLARQKSRACCRSRRNGTPCVMGCATHVSTSPLDRRTKPLRGRNAPPHYSPSHQRDTACGSRKLKRQALLIVAARIPQTPPLTALASEDTHPGATCAHTSNPTRRRGVRPWPRPSPARHADRDPRPILQSVRPLSVGQSNLLPVPSWHTFGTHSLVDAQDRCWHDAQHLWRRACRAHLRPPPQTTGTGGSPAGSSGPCMLVRARPA